ncbi:hypothetical protein [Burkholderia alba]|uniref:hypothetical protein n=1 Tax=Burkholderia alba TaxID=2683677 RepID=UPI002B05423B|nr:hypothetical protein [Burkholderia alba]
MSMGNDIPVYVEGELQPGQIAFIQSCRPPLTAGDYQLAWQQQVVGVTSGAPPVYQGKQAFKVSGPRFTLPADSVQSVYPPASQSGNFADVMPHIVLNRATLPWERPLPGAGGETPWLALLLLTDAELAGAGATSVPVSQLLHPANGVQGPAIDPATLLPGEAESLCNVIDLPAALFAALAPTLQEVPLLCHARKVNTGNKEELGITADGTFSVVIGNRLIPAQSATETIYTALLVSLEGWGAQLPAYAAAGAAPPGHAGAAPQLRLCVLASWGFRASPGVGSFSGLMRNLSRPGGIGMLAYPHAADVGNPDAQTAFDIGFVPLVNNTRAGEETTSWYRGPLSPAPTNPAAVAPARVSDTLIRYDPATGLFDQSYAVAWQIGRLLGLSDAAFARAMFDWRRGLMRSQFADQAQRALLSRLPGDPALARLAAPRHPDVAPALLHKATLFDVARTYLLDPGDGTPTLPKVIPHARRADALRSQALRRPPVLRALTDDEALGDPLLQLIDDLLGGRS